MNYEARKEWRLMVTVELVVMIDEAGEKVDWGDRGGKEDRCCWRDEEQRESMECDGGN